MNGLARGFGWFLGLLRAPPRSLLEGSAGLATEEGDFV
jgi:hypothetical protein